MAASSSSRQWQKALALLRDYLTISKSSVLPNTSSSKSKATEAAVDAIQNYVKQIAVLPSDEQLNNAKTKAKSTHHTLPQTSGRLLMVTGKKHIGKKSTGIKLICI